MRLWVTIVLLTPAIYSPQSCVQVPLGSDLHVVIENGVAQSYCLAAGTYELGSVPLRPDDGDRIAGPAISCPRAAPIHALALIHGTSSEGVVVGTGTLTLRNLDISGAFGTDQSAAGVNGDHEALENLALSCSRIHDNGSAGITGVAEGLRVSRTEIDHNGSGSDSLDAGIKTVHYALVVGSYFHDNDRRDVWWDCDAPGGDIIRSTLTSAGTAGVHVEISSGDSTSGKPVPSWGAYGFRVTQSTITGNDTRDQQPYGGVAVTSSQNVTVDTNLLIDNHVHELNVWNDSRLGNGHDGCSSGFPTSNVTISNNQYGPLDLAGCDIAGVTCTGNIKIKEGR